MTIWKLIFWWIFSLEGDGRDGCDEHAPYDIIHVGAAAPKTPDILLSQLKNGGRLICPVGPQYGAQYLEQVIDWMLEKSEKILEFHSFSDTVR